MKINQFAHLEVSDQQKISELKRINFMPTDEQDLSLNELFTLFLRKALTCAHSESSFDQKLHGLVATSQIDLADFLATKQLLSAQIFYGIAMQLLDFEVTEDFDIDDPFPKMDEYRLFHHLVLKNKMDLIRAWYDLLCTHTKDGSTYLDELAAKGYFTQFFDLPIDQKPLIFNGKTQPVFDTSKLIREVVYVESSLDTDHDGKRDLLKAQIIRPIDTEQNLKVPVLYTASPYNEGTNDVTVAKMEHNVNVPLQRKEPNNYTYADIEYHGTPSAPAAREVKGETRIAEETFDNAMPVTLNNYFLARGFAVVYAAGIGTKDSDGVRTCGSKEETLSTTAIIEWLTGQRRAFTNKTDNIAIKAWWCNGSVAMTGKSYLGTLSTAAATTGVPGLKTIISEAAISNWYDYYRDGGLVIAPGGFPGEDADVLAEDCFSRQKEAGDYLKCKTLFQNDLKKIALKQDRATGNYNTFWDARNYLKDVKNIKCDIVMVHGLEDWNVKLRNVYNLYQGVRDLPITKKLLLHQGPHIYMNNFQSIDFTDMMNLWLSNKLYGIQNNANEVLPAVCVQDNTTESTWHTFDGWHTTNPQKHCFNFQPHQLTSTLNTRSKDIQSFNDQMNESDFKYYQNHWDEWRSELVKDEPSKLSHNRLIFKSPQFKKDIYLQGCPHLKLRVASSVDKGMLSFMIMDLGEARRLNKMPSTLKLKALHAGYEWRVDNLMEYKLMKEPTPWQMITKGHINLQNRENSWKVDDLIPHTFYDLELDLQPMFYHLLKNHQLGLIVYSTDMEMTVRGNEDITYSLDLSHCQLNVKFEEFK